jgi:hypothetical protein
VSDASGSVSGLALWARLCLAVVVICIGLWHEGCGPGLLQQVQLRALSDRATADCLAAGKSCSDMKAGQTPACLLARSRCQASLACATAVQSAENDIQTLQKARASSGATVDQIAVAAGSEASARSYCKAGGWH